jgi:hypothetical protein
LDIHFHFHFHNNDCILVPLPFNAVIAVIKAWLDRNIGIIAEVEVVSVAWRDSGDVLVATLIWETLGTGILGCRQGCLQTQATQVHIVAIFVFVCGAVYCDVC